MSPPKGFTLFETLIALFILTAVSVLAIPPIDQARRRAEFAAVTQRVTAQLHETRSLALSRDQDCRLRVTTETSYIVECQTTADWQTVGSHALPAGYSVAANNAPEFHPLGNVAPMATIRLLNEKGEEMRVIVSRSGRVRTEG